MSAIHGCSFLIFSPDSNHSFKLRCVDLFYPDAAWSRVHSGVPPSSLITQNYYPACLQNLFLRIYLKRKEQMLVNKRGLSVPCLFYYYFLFNFLFAGLLAIKTLNSRKMQILISQ